ncbi:hypothetical protein [Gephyromycinifex aptenodytis]|uniref:hypothetical protein n=1 Tax=Gephyromycinifex aptenodytis TaxID=2716227 RepID=UPI00144605A2|nr:hypothetical protein [Gephyromycinifex aptenodytis]
MNIIIAVLLAMVAAAVFALGATVQSRAVGRTVSDHNNTSGVVGVRQMATLLRSGRWLGSVGIMIVGGLLHILALTLAPISIVQPVGVLAIPFAVLLAAHRARALPGRGVAGAVALTVLAVVVFVAIAASDGHSAPRLDASDIAVAAAGLAAVAAFLAAVGGFGPRWSRCLAWATGGAVIYGLSSALLRADTMLIAQGEAWTGPVLWLALTVLTGFAVGGWMIQHAHANGPPAVILGCLTVVDPMIAVIFGIAFLGEGSRLAPVHTASMLAAGFVASVGVVLLARHHPESDHLPATSAAPVERCERGSCP